MAPVLFYYFSQLGPDFPTKKLESGKTSERRKVAKALKFLLVREGSRFFVGCGLFTMSAADEPGSIKPIYLNDQKNFDINEDLHVKEDEIVSPDEACVTTDKTVSPDDTEVREKSPPRSELSVQEQITEQKNKTSDTFTR